MIKKTFNYFGEIEVTPENCEQIFNEATKVLTLAIEVSTINEYERMKSVHHGMAVKRGLEWKKQNGYKRSEESGAIK